MAVNKKWVAFGLLMIILSLLFGAMIDTLGQQEEIPNEMITTTTIPLPGINDVTSDNDKKTPASELQIFLEKVKDYERTNGKLSLSQQEKVDRMYMVIIDLLTRPSNATNSSPNKYMDLQDWGSLLKEAPWESEMPNFFMNKEELAKNLISNLEIKIASSDTSDFQDMILESLIYQVQKNVIENKVIPTE